MLSCYSISHGPEHDWHACRRHQRAVQYHNDVSEQRELMGEVRLRPSQWHEGTICCAELLPNPWPSQW
eukprot:COSAG02_NODE_65387_length_258_cov_0.647799_1_plen_67_part_01